MPRKKVLILGATGKIGTGFLEECKKYKRNYDIILGVHKKHINKQHKNISNFKIIKVDILNLKSLIKAMKNIHIIIHLAASPNPKATFEELLKPNIIGCYNVFEAAYQSKCKRIIFASSIHAIKGYYKKLKNLKIKTNVQPKPITIYGATKIFGENLCYIYSQKGLSCIAIRIGAYIYNSNDLLKRRNYNYVITNRDLAQLIHKCIIAKNIKFAILHGSSDNKIKFLDLKETKKLVGYKPKDDAFKILSNLKNREIQRISMKK